MRILHRGKTESGFVLLRTLIAMTVLLMASAAIISVCAFMLKSTAVAMGRAERIIEDQNKRTEHALK